LNKKSLIFFIFIFLAFFISFVIEIRILRAQPTGLSLTIQYKFEMTQYSEIKGSNQSVDSINIQLPSSVWTVDSVELNFSDTDYGIELITIEDGVHSTFKKVYNKNSPQHMFGQAVQIKLDLPSVIYGVYIYGYIGLSHPGTPQIQIRGYDKINRNPNSTLYGSTNLNLSSIEGWYLQKFASPISLTKGNYYLVLNGSSLPVYSVEGAGFWWAYNNIDPLNPQLNTSECFNQWNIGSSGSPFLYKLIQKIDLPFFPEENNMTVKISNDHYSVANGSFVGDGYLRQINLNYVPGADSISLSVFNNNSTNLIFNVSYQLNINQIIMSSASVVIQEEVFNKWTITPEVIRYSNNDSVMFHYPLSWENLTIYKDHINISSMVFVNPTDKTIFITNQTISSGAEWEITANSPSIPIILNAPKLDYYLGQELLFSLANPILNGNYTFILINSADTEEFRNTKTIPPESNIFSYELPLSSPDGTYIAYIFWNNQTDAGVISQDFIISIPVFTPQDNTIFIIVILILTIVPALGIAAYIAYKRLSKIRRYKMQRLLEKCVDILNLNYFIVTDIKSGIDIYSQSFGEQKSDPSLISGFLQAVRAFGSEISADKESKTVKIQYKNSILLMTEFVNVRLILNMKETPSADFHYAVESLAYDVYKHYGKAIDEFHGNIKDFKGIKQLVEKHLNVSFIYPLKVKVPENVKLNLAESRMVEKAMKFIKDYDFDYIYSLYLLPENECSPKDAQNILNLIEKGVFVPQK